jgi:HK97 gp10 family phage protein
MAGAVGVQVFTNLPGLEAIERTAKKRAITLKAVKAGAKLVQVGAKARVPKRKGSGALKQSLGIKSQKGTRGKTLALAVIGARSKVVKVFKGKTIKPAKYSHLVEKGTRAHSLTRKKRLTDKVKVRGTVAKDRGQHPGARPKPFLKPSLDTQRQAIGAVMLRVLGEEISKAAPKKG